jgi:hypothetical protein
MDRFFHKITLLITLTLLAIGSQAAITIGVHSSNAATANTSLTTTGVTTTTGSTFVIAVIIHSTASVTSVGDNKGNTYTQMGTTVAGNAGSNKLLRYYCQNCAGGSGHTATIVTGTSIGPSIFFVELKGVNVSGGPLIANQNQDSATPYTSPSSGSLSANEALVSVFVGSAEATATIAESSGFTVQETVTDGTNFWTGALATRVGTAASTYTASWTESVAGASNGPPFAVSIDGFSEATATPITVLNYHYRDLKRR